MELLKLMNETALVWLRQDLRLTDNRALWEACKSYHTVIPVFIYSPNEYGGWPPGAANRWWLHQNLLSLGQSLQNCGSQLKLFEGNALSVIEQLVAEQNISAVYCNRVNEPALLARDEKIEKQLTRKGVDFFRFNDRTLVDINEIQTKTGSPYKVFTPFYRSWRKQLANQDNAVLPQPEITAFDLTLTNEKKLDALNLLDSFNWHHKLAHYWQPGEQQALDTSQQFIEQRLPYYSSQRDFLNYQTSRLSAYLQLGVISPKQILAQLIQYDVFPDNSEAEHFVREIAWRDFANSILVHFPQTTDQPLNERYKNFIWHNDNNAKQFLNVWQQGKTGIPIVDAGMRELWATGTMHNRVRMITASLLCKNGLIHWLHGARWFWDTLLDADLASNSLNWQWAAGCGADAAPYFRIFNPVTQSRKFDPEGKYIRRWLPELANLDNKRIHAPHESTKSKSSALSFEFDNMNAIPKPVVDLKQSREQAINYYQSQLSHIN